MPSEKAASVRPTLPYRVTVVGKHPWTTYAGEVLGPWPGREGGYLVALDNGINIRAEARNVAVEKGSVREALELLVQAVEDGDGLQVVTALEHARTVLAEEDE